MLNLGAYQPILPLPQNSYVTINCSYNWLVFAPVYTDIIANTNHSSTPNLSSPSISLLSERYQKLFPIHKPKTELLSFSSKVLVHLSYNKKMASVVPLSLMNPNCISSISICCWVLYLKIFSTIFTALVMAVCYVHHRPIFTTRVTTPC